MFDGSEIGFSVPGFKPITTEAPKEYTDITYDEVAKKWKESGVKKYTVTYDFARDTLQFKGEKINPTPLADRLKELS